MNKTMCPGQDTRFWQPGDIFDSRCGNCGNVIEFFKDDASQRCKKCGTKVQNPRLNMGCAQWCEHARECLGYDPKEQDSGDSGNVGYDMTLADMLLNEIAVKFGNDSSIYKDAVERKKKAESLIDIKGGKPRIALPASILLYVDNKGEKGSEPSSFDEKLPITKGILEETEMDPGSINEISDIIVAFNKGEYIASDEFRLVSESIGSPGNY